MLNRVVCNLAQTWKNDDLARFFELMTQMGQCLRNGDLQGFYQSGMQFLHSLYD